MALASLSTITTNINDHSSSRTGSASTTSPTSPTSPGADFRRPSSWTATSSRSQPRNSRLVVTNDSARPRPLSGNSSHSLASEYLESHDHAEQPEEYTYAAFSTMRSLCNEMDIPYPPPLSHIEDVGSYTGPVLSPVATNIVELREPPVRKVMRRASVVGRHAKRFSGSLGRRASKLLGLTTAQDVVRARERSAVDDDWDSFVESHAVDTESERSTRGEDGVRVVGPEFREVNWGAPIHRC